MASELNHRQNALWECFDQRLDQPLRVERGAGWVEVWVFDSFSYRHDFETGVIGARHLAFDGSIKARSGRLRLSPALGARGFAHLVEESARLDGACIPGIDDQPYYPPIYRRLYRDPRFQRMRIIDIPHLLGLDPAVLDLARRCRMHPVRGQVLSDEYEFTFRHFDALRHEYERSPRLLPWLALISEGHHSSDAAPGEMLLQRFLDAGLSRKSFSYARRVGIRWARPLLQGVRREDWTEVLIALFRLLDRVGRPAWIDAPLLERFVSEALRLNGWRGLALPQLLDQAWATVAVPRLLQSMISLPTHLAEEVLQKVALVCDECAMGRIVPRRNESTTQLIERARRSAEKADRLRLAAMLQAPHALSAYRDETSGLTFTPLRDGREIVEVGLKLRTCLVEKFASYLAADRLIAGIHAPDGKLMGCVELLLRGGSYWAVGEIAGFANRELGRSTSMAAFRYVDTLVVDSPELHESSDPSLYLNDLGARASHSRDGALSWE